jgi:hypothetical protein
MANTSSTLASGTAMGAQGGKGNNGRYGLRAKLAVGVAVVGCAAALTLGGARTSERAPVVPAATTVANSQLGGAEPQRFLEQNLTLPTGEGATVGGERLRFLEVNTRLPEGRAPAFTTPAPAHFPGKDH